MARRPGRSPRLRLLAVVLLCGRVACARPLVSVASEHALRERSFVLTVSQAAQNMLRSNSQPKWEGEVNAESADGGATRRRATPRAFTHKEVQVSGRIENRMASTTVSMSAEPEPEAREAEVVLDVPEGAFIDSLQIVIGTRIMQATVKEAGEALVEYEQAKEQGKTAALAESRGTNAFALRISIGAGDRTTVTIGYQQYLTSRRGQYEYALALRPRGSASARPQVTIDLAVEDADGLQSISVQEPEMKCAFSDTSAVNMQCGMSKYEEVADKRLDAASIQFGSLNSAVIRLRPTHVSYANKNDADWDGTWRVESDGSMSIDLLVSIAPKKAPDDSNARTGTLILDDDGYFAHVFRNPSLQSMPKTVVLVIDTSGSMRSQPCSECKNRMDQAKEAAHGILKQLNDADEFGIVGFSGSADRILSGCNPQNCSEIIQAATPKNVELAHDFIKGLYPRGSTNIFEAVMTGISMASPGSAPFVPGWTSCWPYPIIDGKCHDVSWDVTKCGDCPGRKADLEKHFCYEGERDTTSAGLPESYPSPAPQSPPPSPPPRTDAAFLRALQWLAFVSLLLMIVLTVTGFLVCCCQFQRSSHTTHQAPGYEMQVVTNNVQGNSANVVASHFGNDNEGTAPASGPAPSAPLASAPTAPSTNDLESQEGHTNNHEQHEHVPRAVYQSEPRAALPPASLGYAQNVPVAVAVPVAQTHAPYTHTVPFTPVPAGQIPVEPFSRKVAMFQLAVAVVGLFFGWAQLYFPATEVACIIAIVASCYTLKMCTCCMSTELGYLSCSRTWSVISVIAAGFSALVSLAFFFIWMGAANSIDNPGYYGEPAYGYGVGGQEYCNFLHVQASHNKYTPLAAARARMVLLLTDGYATTGAEQTAYGIAHAARKQASRAMYPVSVHGLAFGKGGDLGMLRVLSAGSGGIATRIYDDADMDAQVLRFFESVGQPLMTNLTFEYIALLDKSCSTPTCEQSCARAADDSGAGGICQLTQQPQTSLYEGSTLVLAGRMPEIVAGTRARALRVKVKGLAAGQEAEARYESVHTFGKGDSVGVLVGAAASGVKKIWAQISVGEALEACPFYLEQQRMRASEQMKRPQAVTEEARAWDGCALAVDGKRVIALAKTAALEAKIVTPFTSMVITTVSSASNRRSLSNCTTSTNSSAASSCNVSANASQASVSLPQAGMAGPFAEATASEAFAAASPRRASTFAAALLSALVSLCVAAVRA